MTRSSKHPQYGRRSHSQIWTKTGGSTFMSKDLSLRNVPAGRFVDQVMDILPPPTGEALKTVALSHLLQSVLQRHSYHSSRQYCRHLTARSSRTLGYPRGLRAGGWKLKRLENLQGDLEEGVNRADSALADIKKNKGRYPFGPANKRRHVGYLRVIRDKTADCMRTARE